MMSGPDPAPVPGYRHACALFAASGLTVPLVPWELRRRLREHAPWRYATRPLGWSPYSIEVYLAEAERYRVPDYAVLAHAGHGVNSYAIHYFLVHRRLRLFVQIGWGGSYMDGREARDVWDAFAFCDRIVAAANRVSHARVPDGAYVTIAVSNFYGHGWARPGDPFPSVTDNHAPRFREPLGEALAWLEEGAGR